MMDAVCSQEMQLSFILRDTVPARQGSYFWPGGSGRKYLPSGMKPQSHAWSRLPGLERHLTCQGPQIKSPGVDRPRLPWVGVTQLRLRHVWGQQDTPIFTTDIVFTSSCATPSLPVCLSCGHCFFFLPLSFSPSFSLSL